MTTAAQYRQQINEILGIDLEEGETYQWDYETVGEAQVALTDIRTSRGRLEEIRRALVVEMKAIRDDYRDKMANAAAGSSTAMSLLGRKQKAGQMKADAKRQLRLKRNETLAPYEEVKNSLDRLISDLGKQAAAAQKFADSGDETLARGHDAASEQTIILSNFYYDTPPAGSQMALEPTLYGALEPIKPPEELLFDRPKPAEPELQDAGLRGLFSGGRRQQIEEENRRLQADYERQTQEWEGARATAEASLAQEQGGYQAALAAWQERKETFDLAEATRVQELEAARLSDPGTMRALLGRRLDSLVWPPELEMEFASEYFIEGRGAIVRLEVCLPGQEQWPERSVSPGYIDLVHAIGFRLAGQVFYVLPGVQTVLLSGFVEDPDRPSRYDNKSTLYSSRVSRHDWGQVDFSHIETLDMVAIFNLFETRRQITESGELAPVNPFRK